MAGSFYDDMRVRLVLEGDSEGAVAAVDEITDAMQDVKKAEDQLKNEKGFMPRRQLEADATRAKLRQLGGELKLTQGHFNKTAIKAEMFNTRLEGMQKRMAPLISSAKALAIPVAAVGLAAVGAAKKIWDLAAATAEIGNRFEKAAPAMGLTIEDLSRLEYAAERSNVSFEQLSVGVRQLNKNMADVAMGAGEAKAALRDLGIDVVDNAGNLKDTQELLFELADAFSSYADGAGKSAAAQRIFGESGAQMIPLLNQGRDGIRKLMEESDRLGNTWSTAAAKDAAEFEDALTDLNTALEGMRNELGREVIPALTEFIDVTTSAAEWMRENGHFMYDWAAWWYDHTPNIYKIISLVREWRSEIEFVPGGVSAGEYFGPLVNPETGEFEKPKSIKPKGEGLTPEQEAEIAGLEDMMEARRVEQEQAEERARQRAEDMENAQAYLAERLEWQNAEYQAIQEHYFKLADLRMSGLATEQQIHQLERALWRDKVNAYSGAAEQIGAAIDKTGRLAALASIPRISMNIADEIFEAGRSAASYDYLGAALHTAAAAKGATALEEARKAAKGGGGGGGGRSGGGGGGGGGGAAAQPALKEQELDRQQRLLVKVEGLEGIRPDYLYTGDQLIGLVKSLQSNHREGNIPNPFQG